MSESASDTWLVVGKITGCYGLKGWLKVQSYTEPKENFLAFGDWQLQCRDGYEPVVFDEGKAHGKGLLVHINGVDDRNQAQTYAGLKVAVREDALPPLEEGDYYWRQLQGLQVWCQLDDKRVLLGRVDYLIETGANDVLVVKSCSGSLDDRERLIPYLPGDTVLRVDLDEAVIEVDWFLDED